eukprot:TRINITY_DN485_c0_g1_i7.p1 TRINITY_DN485_c0_g1~~TRINITY_DN485_c0_g1_i7.p1  ORF type:complete len:202 (+),score=59.82 TRINITY_DN485_c0_g1_i7:129-734(+)
MAHIEIDADKVKEQVLNKDNIQMVKDKLLDKKNIEMIKAEIFKKKNIDLLKAAMEPNEHDREVWRMITTFPEMNIFLKFIIFLLNLMTPGFGTIMMSICGYNKLSKTQLCIGILQFTTSLLLVGYVWSIGWGVIALCTAPRPEVPLSASVEANPFNEKPLAAEPPKPTQKLFFIYITYKICLLYTSPSPRDLSTSRMPSSA